MTWFKCKSKAINDEAAAALNEAYKAHARIDVLDAKYDEVLTRLETARENNEIYNKVIATIQER